MSCRNYLCLQVSFARWKNMLVRTSKTIWEKIQTKVLGKEVKSLFSFFTFATFWRWHLCMCVCVCVCVWWWNVSKKDEENIQKIIFLVFSLVFSKWTSWFEEFELKKRTLFSQQVNNQQLDYSKFSHDDFFIWILKQLVLFWIVCYKNFFL